MIISQDLNEVPLEGEITIPGLQTEEDELSTLDEPVKDTIVTKTVYFFILLIHLFTKYFRMAMRKKNFSQSFSNMLILLIFLIYKWAAYLSQTDYITGIMSVSGCSKHP